MGSRYDELSERAHTRNATGRALRNRLVLERAMERFGFDRLLAGVVALRAPRRWAIAISI